MTVERLKSIFQHFVSAEDEMDAVMRGEPILEATSMDSLAIVHLVTELENEFKTRFDLETLEQTFENIRTLQTFLEEKGEQQP